MKKVSYKNRYNDVYTFTKVESGDILMEGSFEWMRCGYPNVYDRAYDAYKNDHPSDPVISLEEFKVAVHEYENETFDYTPFSKKYQDLVYSDTTKIDMIDPSGGPYIHSDHDMGRVDESFKGMIIDHFKSVPEGYLIIIKK